jgi:2',3'-cyclic-nucleotide 2'-phosphodiesterase (5'-nucleotidase family)
MQFSDLHGKMVPHQEIFQGDRAQNYSGGLTKMATAIKQVRADDPDALLLMVGDTTHGSAETLFTMGESVMTGINSLDIDVFTPGNWDFGHGPRAFRNRFAGGIPGSGGIPLPLPPNNRTTLTGIAGKTCPGLPGTGAGTGQFTCNVTAATFDTVAINLYNYNEAAGAIGPRVLPAYKMLETDDGVKVAVIGITTDVVPQQAQTFNIGFRFTMGYKELPGIIAEAKDAGADVIVVQSELGLSKNLQIVKEIPGVDVMFSGHTHERTHEALLVKHKGNQTIVTEAGEDSHLGRLKLTIKNGAVEGYDWELIELDDAMPEDPAMMAIVTPDRAKFVGAGTTCHTFGPGGFGYGKGHTLCDDLDTVVGTTLVTLERRDVLEDIANNFMVDAFVEAGRQADPTLNTDNSASTTNGFRYDNVVLGQGTAIDGGGTASGDISIGDLYAYYPIGAALALASYSGGRLFDHWEGILSHVFDRNPYRQRGGWNLGFTENLKFDIDLVDLPLSISYPGRITGLTINGAKFDRSKTITLVSCYPHGNPVVTAARQ